ncbi:YkgJ family cysteine cluster protein [Candidatus Saccharibacteria bacterium]|nr:YkgJ family cysteine cluster protein [Candidatus Saccharibacteria bacterium]
MYRELPISVYDPESISCEYCVGACCRAWSQLLLSDDEARFIEESGTRLMDLKLESKHSHEEVVLASNDPRRLRTITTDCGYLKNSRCTVFEDERRPEICRRFPVGSESCKKFREIHIYSQDPSLKKLGEYLAQMFSVVESTAD